MKLSDGKKCSGGTCWVSSSIDYLQLWLYMWDRLFTNVTICEINYSHIWFSMARCISDRLQVRDPFGSYLAEHILRANFNYPDSFDP